MRVLTILALALMLAFSTAASAGDRLVGPETGQARTAADLGRVDPGPDDEAPFVPFDAEPQEISWDQAAIIRWMQWYERNVGPIGF